MFTHTHTHTHTHTNTYIYIYIYTYISWICKFVAKTVGFGTNHKYINIHKF